MGTRLGSEISFEEIYRYIRLVGKEEIAKYRALISIVFMMNP